MGIRQFFNDAVTLGLAAMGQLELDTSSFRINGAGDLRPTKDTPSLLVRAQEGREKYGTKISRFLSEFNSKADKIRGPGDRFVPNPRVEQKTFSQRVQSGLDAAKNPKPRS